MGGPNWRRRRLARRPPRWRAATTVVLDDAHHGDIRGAFGTIGEHDAVRCAHVASPAPRARGDHRSRSHRDGRRQRRRRRLDVRGRPDRTTARACSGRSLLLIPVLIVNQEMVVRLGAVSGVGHGRLIFERFGKIWGRFAVSDLFVLNFLTIATEFIGISLGAQYFGVPAWVAVPLAGLLLVGITVTGRFETWERLMFVILFGNLLCIPLMLLCHPTLGPVAAALRHPRCARWLQLRWRAAHRRHRRNHGHAVAAVLPAVERRRQAHHATLDPVRACRHGDRRADRRHRRDRDHDGHGVRVQSQRYWGAGIVECLHQRVRPRRSLAVTCRPGGGRDLLDPADRRVDRRCECRDALDVVRVRRHVRDQKFAAPVVARGQAVLRDVHGARGARGCVRRSSPVCRSVWSPPRCRRSRACMLPSACLFLLFLCNDRDVLGPWVNRTWFNLLASLILGRPADPLGHPRGIDDLLPNIDVARLFLVAPRRSWWSDW